ncbi:MAG: hypothetical protein IJP68_02680, partial [Selenomonadaceae bacterium]|nr:hypothetical protein [Selenomonadaceae bacterium]
TPTATAAPPQTAKIKKLTKAKMRVSNYDQRMSMFKSYNMGGKIENWGLVVEIAPKHAVIQFVTELRARLKDVVAK